MFKFLTNILLNFRNRKDNQDKDDNYLICPDCCGDQWHEGPSQWHDGPRGGISVNIKCAKCHSWFNHTRLSSHSLNDKRLRYIDHRPEKKNFVDYNDKCKKWHKCILAEYGFDCDNFDFDEWNKIYNWCSENVETWTLRNYVLLFKNKQDSIAFKLQFAGR